MENRIEIGFNSEKLPKTFKNPVVVVKEIIRDIKFHLKTLGIENSLESAEEIAPKREYSAYSDAGSVKNLDKRTTFNLQGYYKEGKLVNLNDAESSLLLKKFEEEASLLPEKLREARIKNIKSYLKLRDLRKENLTDEQKRELDQILKRQVDVANLLKEPNLENHFDRLVNYINDLIASLKQEIGSLNEVKKEEIEEALALFKGLPSENIFTTSVIKKIKTNEHQIRIEESNKEISELENVLAAISRYKNNKNEKNRAAA